ncbi:MAG: SgcJ/EcaC family oxidoreductase [Bacteroidota bacterium]|nr:SgcJ/EcaC family oxidoreductase [Chitinophagaceae bacterium]MDZ4810446.1 SgcJ/EcaC family oxidoreductase [Bacteroidota bacterium]
MKKKYWLSISCCFIAMQFSSMMYAQTLTDSIAIDNILKEEVVSWNNGDAKTYSKHFATNGTFTNVLGFFAVGYTIFYERHDQIFKGPFKGTLLMQDLVSFRFLSSDIAVVETLSSVSGFAAGSPFKVTNLDEKGRLRTRLLQIFVRTGNDWTIASYHNTDVKPGTPVPEPLQ